MVKEVLRRRFMRHVLNSWSNPNTYDATFKIPPELPGIYCLVGTRFFPEFKRELIYVGSSTNLYARYKAHNIISEVLNNGSFEHVSFCFKQMRSAFYDTEIRLIQTLNPPLNKLQYAKAIH